MMGRVSAMGQVMSGFEPVRDEFADVVARQPGTGAAVAAWCEGEWVVDLWGGSVDAAGTRGWERDSIVMPYSVTKPFAAMCALVLVARGLLDLDAPMQRYWPSFKAQADVRQVLSHQAGLVVVDETVGTEAFYDWSRLCDLLADQEPAWVPGTAIGESALFYGHLVGELVRRVDGRTLGRFLRDEICGPPQLDFAVGLDTTDLGRAVDLTGLDEDFRRATIGDRTSLYDRATSNPPGAFDGRVVNGAKWRRAEIPAVNGHGTARAVAGFYAALMQGQVIPSEVLDEAVTPQASGVDRVMGGEERSWGLGFGVDEDGFGMGGTGGSIGWACTSGGYAYGFVTGSIGGHDRSDQVENALRSCLGLPEL
jgi:CubicO group peptidase (beta-lactamase class C family)